MQAEEAKQYQEILVMIESKALKELEGMNFKFSPEEVSFKRWATLAIILLMALSLIH